ncbi:FAD-dependent monooxygenase [Streptomyces sp. NEAU-YJ-81]|uniref:FAD-dependent monooxygenase n=1 Tax=Streptomyces sp. NEAU-YJ-81 TaxID=2820288 RepID=UPI001ABCC0C3|nr:FAD-dependent monooxygenase [Streptomyces sp. NEAU-YJ-81]MBO3679524.1 FAD-dependent monooxygenase [Streptomyces sp. NEAU-YJ-81]
MTREIDTDVCVVGGGPAGLVLALLMLRSGARVTVVECARAHQRVFRGEILQPGAMALLDALDVLAGARARGAHEHDRFLVIEGERVLLEADYRLLAAPYDHLLSVPRPHLLDELLARCRRSPGFRYLPGRRAGALLWREERIAGVIAEGPPGRCAVRARVVVGADGRFSRIRRLAGIGAGRADAFAQDVLWCTLIAPREEPPLRDVRVFRTGGGPVLVYGSWSNRIQIGWTLPHRRYGQIAALGLDHVKERLVRAVPGYATLIRDQIRTPADLGVLEVFSARAERWVADGLVLIGDAAHTHSPIGAQGINLAVQDAVVLHPLLARALAEGDTSAERLAEFERRRGPDIAAVMRMQTLQSRAILSQGAFTTRVRPRLARALRRTPLYRKILQRMAYGNPSIRIADAGVCGRT